MWRRLRRAVRFVVRSLITIALLLIIVAGALVWRLRSGPIPLEFLVPRVKSALALDEGWQLDVEGLELTWRATAHQVELRARGLRVAPPGGGASVTLAGGRLRLSRAALLRGHVSVTAIELDAPALRLVRDRDGRLAMRLDAPEGAGRNADWIGPMLAKLEHVGVRDGRIVFVDEASATTWNVPHVDGDVWRTGGPLRLQIGPGARRRRGHGADPARCVLSLRRGHARSAALVAGREHTHGVRGLAREPRVGGARVGHEEPDGWPHRHVGGCRYGTRRAGRDSEARARRARRERRIRGPVGPLRGRHAARYGREGRGALPARRCRRDGRVGHARDARRRSRERSGRMAGEVPRPVEHRCALSRLAPRDDRGAGSRPHRARPACELADARHRRRRDGARAARIPARRAARLRQSGAPRQGVDHRRDDPVARGTVGRRRRERDRRDGRARASHRRHGDGAQRAGDGAVPTSIRPRGTSTARPAGSPRRRASAPSWASTRAAS